MLLKILLIIFGLPILILPLTTKIIKNKRLTKSGIFFLIIVAIFSGVQLTNEKINTEDEQNLLDERIVLKNKVDSLSYTTLNLSDSLNNLKNILLAIDSQFYTNSNRIFELKKVNDSLNNKIFESDRPIFNLVSTKIYKSKISKTNYMIDFVFGNKGIRATTNVFGNMYTLSADTIFDNGTIPVSKSEVYPHNIGFTVHATMRINPDSTSLDYPIYYYFTLTYSDLILETIFPYEVLMKLNPFSKGNYLKELVTCKDWEINKVKKIIEFKTLPNKL